MRDMCSRRRKQTHTDAAPSPFTVSTRIGMSTSNAYWRRRKQAHAHTLSVIRPKCVCAQRPYTHHDNDESNPFRVYLSLLLDAWNCPYQSRSLRCFVVVDRVPRPLHTDRVSIRFILVCYRIASGTVAPCVCADSLKNDFAHRRLAKMNGPSEEEKMKCEVNTFDRCIASLCGRRPSRSKRARSFARVYITFSVCLYM